MMMTIHVMGALPAPAKRAAIPTRANAIGSGIANGSNAAKIIPNAPPKPAPINRDGANTPPDPPEPSVKHVERILRIANAIRMMIAETAPRATTPPLRTASMKA